MKQLAEGAVVAGREGGLEEEGLVGGDGEAELRADDFDKLGDGVGEGGGVGSDAAGGEQVGVEGMKARSARVVSS